jgi:hypothetical protein
MEEEMRRIAMLLGTLGVVTLGLAGTPSQAQAQGWWGYPNGREQVWHERQAREWAWRHHEWREHHYRQPYQYGY